MTQQQKEYDIRQFKLASGEEVVCEIIQWHNEEELELVVRKVMRLESGNSEEGVRFYSFRPWMVYQENPDEFIILNGNHIVGIGFPTPQLIEQYDEAIDDMAKMYKERMKDYKERRGIKGDISLAKKILKEAEDIEDYLKGLKESDNNDSGDSNILQFDPNKRTLH